MLDLPLIASDQAVADQPAEVQITLAAMNQQMGFVPNLAKLLANSALALEGFVAMVNAFGKSSFSANEAAVILLTASVENDCHYCTSVHTGDALVSGLDSDVTQRIREQRSLLEPRLEALRHTTQLLVRRRGYLTQSHLDAFLQAGFSAEQLLEVVLGISLKTLTNTINHLAATPVDAAFQPNAYAPRAQAF